ncbi:hypothetical protein ACQKJC_18495 [Priestia koreensis]|uniref:hypothetical protein n=1 Tax=Priestia koreensis TaxID=284581 RepID=UPI003D03493B
MSLLEVGKLDGQLADCITVYCMAGLKGRGKVDFQDVTGSFWRFNYRKDPLIFFSIGLFRSPIERNELLKKYFDIDLSVVTTDISTYHDHIMESLQLKDLPMVFIDRYDMPHDEICYQKFHESHYILIQGYDALSDEYHIVDFFTTPSFNRVKKSLLEKSIQNAYHADHPMIIGKLNTINHTFDKSAMNTLIQSNLSHILQQEDPSSGLLGVKSLYQDIDQRDDYLTDYIKVLNLFSKLKHVGLYREQHSKFIGKHFDHQELSKLFIDLNIKWQLTANYLLKAHLTKKDKLIEYSLETIQEIIQVKKEIIPLYENLIKGV